jgi:predicted nucleic acid-binding protein
MTRYVVDPSGILGIVREGITIRPSDELLAPNLLRSEVLSTLHEVVARGELEADAATALLDKVDATRIRYLGDRVLRRLAWKVATEQGWSTTYGAEYLSLTKLQGDAYLTLDEDRRRAAGGIVTLATLDDLR